MADESPVFFEAVEGPTYRMNVTCHYDYVPPAIEYIESLGVFATVFVSLGTIMMAVTLWLSVDAAYAILLAKDSSRSRKRNILLILSVYPIASLCSLVALSVPRAQLLSEAVTQIFLTIAFYRLYLLLIDVGLGDVKKSPPLRLRVGPCCCWPCLPFPDLEMNSTNLSWLQVIVLQLPIVQTLVYCVFAFLAVENPVFATRYGIFLQPLSITSILLGLYGISITVMTLQEVKPGSNLRHKAAVVQLVLLFSKLQGFIIKSLAGTGLFPCNPPITPQVYANFTYNALMLIEMLFLCYAARLVYSEEAKSEEGCNEEQPQPPTSPAPETLGNNSSGGEAGGSTRHKTAAGIRLELDRHNQQATNNNNNNEISTNTGQNLPLNIRLASVTA